MLELSLVECIFRLIPESFLMVLSIYMFSKTDIDKKNYLKASLSLSVLIFVVRKLPINYGVHTIVCMIITICTISYVSNIDMVMGIKGTILSYIFLFICEGINLFILKLLFNDQIGRILNNNNLKTLFAVPSLIIFASILCIYYKIIKKRKKLSHDK